MEPGELRSWKGANRLILASEARFISFPVLTTESEYTKAILRADHAEQQEQSPDQSIHTFEYDY